MAKNNGETTVIAQGVKVEGNFVCEGDIHIAGEVEGMIQSQGDLQVGEGSKIRADIVVQNAYVAGDIRGNMLISGRLELTESANIIGDVSAEVLSIAPGAKVNGNISMGDTTGAEAVDKNVKEKEADLEDEEQEDEHLNV